MANKEALRDLQTRLAGRLQAVQSQPRADGWLAVEVRGHGLLFPLAQAGEIFACPTLLPVPRTQPWFIGVANLRGGLHGVVDLAQFLGLAPQPAGDALRDAARLVALNPRLGVNTALRVERLLGLRSREQLTADLDDPGPRPAWAGPRWRDAGGRVWQEIVLKALAEDARFLDIVP